MDPITVILTIIIAGTLLLVVYQQLLIERLQTEMERKVSTAQMMKLSDAIDDHWITMQEIKGDIYALNSRIETVADELYAELK